MDINQTSSQGAAQSTGQASSKTVNAAVVTDRANQGFGPDFSTALKQALGKDGDANEAEISLATLLTGMNPAWMLAVLPQDQAEKVEQTAAQVVEELGQNPSAVLRAISESPLLQGWLSQAAAWLSAHGGDSGFADASASSNMNNVNVALNTTNIANASQMTASVTISKANTGVLTAVQIEAVLKQFVEAMRQIPNQPAVQQLAQSFQASFEPILALPVETKGEHAASSPNSGTLWVTGQLGTADKQTNVPSGHNGTNQTRGQPNALSLREGQAAILSSSLKDSGLQQPIRSNPQTQLAALDFKHSFHSVAAAAAADSSMDTAQSYNSKPLIQWIGSNPSLSSALFGTSFQDNVLRMQGLKPAVRLESTAQADINQVPIMAIQNQDGSKYSQTDTIKPPIPQPMDSQQFVQEMSRLMLKNMKITELNGFSEARILLIPEHLGKVDVRITMHNGQLAAHFMADSLLGKDMLENQLPQLRLALQNQGLQVDKLDVSQSSSLQSGMFQDHRQHASSQQQFFRQQSGRENDYDQQNASFEARLNDEGIAESPAYGYSFDATA